MARASFLHFMNYTTGIQKDIMAVTSLMHILSSTVFTEDTEI